MTTQREIRAGFWQEWQDTMGSGKQANWLPNEKDYNATVRSAFCEYVDWLQKDGHISEALAARVTL